MKPTELFDLAREVYRYINVTPMVSRGIMNTHFRTSSDDRRNRELTEALEALLARLYVFKFTDEGTAQVFFWTQEFVDSPYEPDDEPILGYTPVDIFGVRPSDEAPQQVETAPAATPYESTHVVMDVPKPEHHKVEENSPEFKAMQKMLERVGGKLKPVYERMMQEPLRVFGKADEEFAFLGDHVQRAMMLGRMFGLGYIRRFKDPTDAKVSYYTIYGQCPESLIEDSVELGKAAQKRQKAAREAQERKELIDRVNTGIDQRKEAEAEEVERVPESAEKASDEELLEEYAEEEMKTLTEGQENEEEESESEGDEEPLEEQIPEAYFSNRGNIFIRLKDNTAVDLDEDESMAVLEMFVSLDTIKLLERLAAYKRKKENQ